MSFFLSITLALFLYSKDVVFVISEGTNDKQLHWNSPEDPVVAEVGDRLIIINEDNQNHRLHTDGRPCAHGSLILPGESWSCVLEAPYNALEEKYPTRDHMVYDSKFWIIVLEGESHE